LGGLGKAGGGKGMVRATIESSLAV
jgi:hypothetical protein